MTSFVSEVVKDLFALRRKSIHGWPFSMNKLCVYIEWNLVGLNQKKSLVILPAWVSFHPEKGRVPYTYKG